MNNVIEIKELSKSFGDVKAVQGISFSVEKGSLFAFLGVNGAGKSTTISMMCGQLIPDSGSVIIDGMDISRNEESVKAALGVVFQGAVLDKPLSVSDNLKYRASLYGICGESFDRRLSELSELLDMKDILKRPYGKLSGGQRRKADIARALLHNPKILILDEPTTGLDPQTRKMVWSVIDKLRRSERITVFLTTHYMEEAADADRVVILDGGKIVAEGTPIELKNQYAGDFVTVYGRCEDEIKMLDLPYESVTGGYRIRVENAAAATSLIVAYPELFRDCEVIKGKMDDVFLAATGKSLRIDDGSDKKKGKRK